MFGKILIANRGEIACRVMKTARRMGIRTVAVYSDADRDALHVRMADEAVHVGPSPAAQSYIAIDRILDAVRKSGAEAVHPGYGFLSERAEFARALDDAGVVFIGPPVAAIEAMGDKITSKKLAAEAGVSTVPGFMGLIHDAEEAVRIARQIGHPVMIKASAGGGGKGMRIARSDAEVREGFQSSRNEAAASFGDDRIFIEKFIESPRHIEIQVLGDRHGNIIHLGERECSIQRRNQKVIEEAPSPFLDPETRAAMGAQAVALARAVGYHSAGTVEFIVDRDRNFYFLEMNTRLQVEHPVTELVTGLDLVELMIRVAAGEALPFGQEDVRLDGWAIECRLYAEDPYRNFLPSTGRLVRYRPPEEIRTPRAVIRNDTGVEEGGEISMFYDPMIAKLCSWGPDRAAAIAVMRGALDAFEVEGIGHNLPFCQVVMDHPRFVAGDLSTAFIAEEFPDGFAGVVPPPAVLADLARGAAVMRRAVVARERAISGRMAHHTAPAPDRWVVTLAGQAFTVDLGEEEPGGAVLTRSWPGNRPPTAEEAAAEPVHVAVDWLPGRSLARIALGGAGDGTRDYLVKVGLMTEGFRLRWRGADLAAMVRTPRAAELAALMPERTPPDTSRLLLCPMPGILVSIAVEAGQEVEEGQPLATVEAMKMENILRAERRGRVARINAAPGDSLAVDAVIMEFE
ncbi:MAG: acetyl/propionyl/methylcrotonyl-CoA carboxylase subunit alpha [Alphaproteobacteria bacterium]|nr:MAG: acetyl/propionyl/methylcrotonyl-CoA carboxylase subunit alpha [Alphaproteobacteria bacterium]